MLALLGTELALLRSMREHSLEGSEHQPGRNHVHGKKVDAEKHALISCFTWLHVGTAEEGRNKSDAKSRRANRLSRSKHQA